MKTRVWWIVVAALVVLAIISARFSYWMVALGLIVIAIALGVSIGRQQAGPPAPSE